MILIILEKGKEVTLLFNGIACNSQLVDSDVNDFLKIKTGRSEQKAENMAERLWVI